MRIPIVAFLSSWLLAVSAGAPMAMADASWEAEVYPSERYITTDTDSGAELVFATTSPASESNLYFHQRSWLPSEEILFFRSDRTGRTEVFGYLEATGELVRFQREGDESPIHVTASRHEEALYFVRGKRVFAWTFDVSPLPENPRASRVRVHERRIGDLPRDMTISRGINESSHGRGIVAGFVSSGPHQCRVIWMDKKTGAIREIAAVDFSITHIQSSWETPGLVSFARDYGLTEKGDRSGPVAEGRIRARIWLADLSDRAPWPIYPQEEDELVTHECWWVGDKITFISGQNIQEDPQFGFAEDAHVKVYDTKTDTATIVGAGAWWEGFSADVAAKLNWWHASGAPNGLHVAADNFHGDIGLFSAKTARTRTLTSKHLPFRNGEHPHVGWNPAGTRVVLTSNRFGNPDVCIAEVPPSWRSGW